jgi:hypothetical protein
MRSGLQTFLTFPAAESILNYRPSSVREKIASKSPKAFNGGSRTVGKKTGVVVNKPELVGAIDRVPLSITVLLDISRYIMRY